MWHISPLVTRWILTWAPTRNPSRVGPGLSLASAFLTFRKGETSASHSSVGFWILLTPEMRQALGHSCVVTLSWGRRSSCPHYSGFLPSCHHSLAYDSRPISLFNLPAWSTGQAFRSGESLVCFVSLLVSNGVKDLSVGLTVFSRFVKREGRASRY